MRLESVWIAIGTLLASARAQAQQCPEPAVAPQASVMDTLPWSPDDAFNVVQRILKDLKYKVEVVDTQRRVIRTQVNSQRPQAPELRPFRNYPYPGIQMEVAVRDVEGQSEITWRARARCRVDKPPPPGYDASVESVFETFASSQVEIGLGEEFLARQARTLTAPRPLDCAPLQYSQATGRDLIDTTVVVHFIVDTLGHAEPASIRVNDAPTPDVARAAIDFVRGCRFRPAWAGDRPVRAVAQMPVRFTSR